MKDVVKEIAIGLALAGIVFLVIKGFDLTPFLLIGAMFFILMFMMDGRSTNRRFGLTNRAPAMTIPLVTFEDIGGQEVAKREFQEALDFMRLSNQVRKLGIRPLKGILLTGPPGTGKTLMAKAAANYTDSVFVTASGSQFVEMYAGVGAQRVRQLFTKVRNEAEKASKDQGIIFIDEIDVLGAKRGKNSSHMEYDQTLNELLTQIDGIKVNENIRILIVGATNRVDLLDSALLRPGRFDRIVNVDLPDKDGRLHILKIHAKGKPFAADVDLEQVAKETFGFSGAHLESLLNEAAIQAMRAKRQVIKNKDLKEAVEKVMLGERLDRNPSLEEKKRIAYHETGHALLAEKTNAGSVSSVTITSRGNALGYMRQNPEDDQYLYTKHELLDRIQVCMAGIVAEEIILGQRSTGGIGDIEQATKIARQMVFAGLSNLGVVSDDLPPTVVARVIGKIIKEQEDVVRHYLIDNQQRLKAIAETLLEQEKLSGEEFRNIAGKTA